MTDTELDGLIRAALLEAESQRYAAELDGSETLSWAPARGRRMEHLLRDPLPTARRWARPVWRSALQTAACLLLALTVMLGGILAASPTARAWLQRIIEEWTDTYTTFHFTGQSTGEAVGLWRPAYLPEGFTELGAADSDTSGYVEYENAAGDTITFDYRATTQGSGFDTDNEHSDYRRFIMNGQAAHLFTSKDELWPSVLIWFDKTGEIGFQLIAYVEEDELLQIAESIYLE